MMKHWTLVVFVGVVLAGAVASAQDRGTRPDAPPAAAQDAKAPAAPSGDVNAGKKLYKSSGCFECHGTVAQGSPRTGPMLLTQQPFNGFLRQLRRPVAEMPPYQEKVLTDQQVADIYAFIQTLPKPVDYKTIKILQ